MYTNKNKPAWWVLYVLVPIMIGLLIGEGELPIPTGDHRIFEMGIVLVGFVSFGIWVHANEGALLRAEAERYRDITLDITEYTPTGEILQETGNLPDEQATDRHPGRRVLIRRRPARPIKSSGQPVQFELDQEITYERED
ncbi:MAG: hypothetical protein WCF84_09990 [Anaerolineae bacterium]